MRVLNGLVISKENSIGSPCCEKMANHLTSAEVSIVYNAPFREYGILMKWEKSQDLAIEQIYYCPWCGTELPKILRDEWFDHLEDDLGLDEPDDPNVPEEMFSEAWWRKKGL